MLCLRSASCSLCQSNHIQLLLPRAREGKVSSLLLLYLQRFLFFAAWLALEQAVQGAGLVFLISGLVCSWSGQESIFQNKRLAAMFLHGCFLLLWEQEWCQSVEQVVRKGNPLPRRSPLQPRQLSQVLCVSLCSRCSPCLPSEALSLLGAPCSSWVFGLSHLPGSGSLSHGQ